MLLCLCLVCGTSQADSLVIEQQTKLELTEKSYDLYFDYDKSLTIEQVLSSPPAFNSFDESSFAVENSANLWARFNVDNTSVLNEWVFEFDYSQHMMVSLFVVKNGQIIAEDYYIKDANQANAPTPRVFFSAAEGEQVQLYAKVLCYSTCVMPLKLSDLDSYESEQYLKGILWGGFYGGLMLLTLYNLALSFVWRDANVFRYIVFIVTVIIWGFAWSGQLNVIPFEAVVQFLVTRLDFVFLLLILSASYFSAGFLNLKQSNPRLNWIINLIMLLSTLFAVLVISFADSSSDLLLICDLSILLLSLIVFHANYRQVKAGYVGAGCLLFGWSIALLSALFDPISPFVILTGYDMLMHSFQVAVILMTWLFSLALVLRMRVIMQDNVDQVTDELRNNLEFIELQNAELHIARKNAMQASKIKSQFLANMSHEIRTPLNSIVGFSRQLEKQDIPRSIFEMVDVINTSATHLVTVINDILDVSKIEAGKIELENQPFNLDELAQESVAIFAPQAFKKHLEFLYSFNADYSIWQGDPLRIRQIITNLLSNAIKFTDSGCVELKISQNGAEQLVIEVNDSGVGMTLSQQQKVFDAFAQADNSTTRKFGGTGLGLLICRELSNMMNGDIKVQSEKNTGTAISVHLPLKSDVSSELPPLLLDMNIFLQHQMDVVRSAWSQCVVLQGGSPYSFSTPNWQKLNYDVVIFGYEEYLQHQGEIAEMDISSSQRLLAVDPGTRIDDFPEDWIRIEKPVYASKLLKKLHLEEEQPVPVQKNPLQGRLNGLYILVVDDVPLNMRLIGFWLEDSDAVVMTAENGLEALRLCEQQKFDMILMDIQMPVMDGMEATVKIREGKLNKETPIVAVTAHAFKEEKQKMRAVGMTDVLSKPMEEAEFIQILSKYIGLDIQVDATEQKTQSEAADKSIDWQYAVKQANGNEDIARDIFAMFLSKIPQHLQAIDDARDSGDPFNLIQQVHKFHGASCYTGVPKLRALCFQIETALKKDPSAKLENLFQALSDEAREVDIQASSYI